MVWHHPRESRRVRDGVGEQFGVLWVNMGCQSDIRAMVVVFVDVCLRVGTWVKGGRRKKADFLFNCRAKGPLDYHSCNIVNIRNYSPRPSYQWLWF